MRKWLPIVLLCAAPALAEKYTGPRPPKPDLPYLVHADNLIATESSDASQEERKGDIIYVIAGAASPARTPLSSPIFLLQAEEIPADRLQLYRLQSRNGRREVLFSHKKKLVARPFRVNVTHLDENLYKIEVDEILENGEYSLTPSDSNKVFCFQVY